MSDTAIQNLVSELKITTTDFKTITNSMLRGATNEDIVYFLKTAQSLKLNPLAKQITAFKTWNNDLKSFIIQAFPTIDGLRVIAERSGNYEGQTMPQFCGDDGIWVEFWSLKSKGFPSACKVGIYKKGFREAVFGICQWDSYKRTNKAGELSSRWAIDPLGMLAKCSEAQGLRRAFPNDLGGQYADVEMSNEDEQVRNVNEPSGPDPADEAEKYKILTDILEVCKKNNYSTDNLKSLILEKFGKNNSKELTLEETKDLANDIVDILSNIKSLPNYAEENNN